MVPDPNAGAASQDGQTLVLGSVSIRQIARTLHGLGSRVTQIEQQFLADVRMLVYTFDVVGQRQSFSQFISHEPIESIADLYPETAAWEQELAEHAQIQFR